MGADKLRVGRAHAPTDQSDSPRFHPRRGERNPAKWAVAGAAILALALAAQIPIRARFDGPARVALGYCVSAALMAGIGLLGRSRRGASHAQSRQGLRIVVLLATCLLLANLGPRVVSPGLALPPRLGTGNAWLVLLGAWAGFVVWIWRTGISAGKVAVGLAAAAIASHGLIVITSPFDRLPGDMLWNINRALTRTLRGDFPHPDSAPPMTYLPGTWLPYMLPRLAGVDLRVANLLMAGVMLLVAGLANRKGGNRRFDWWPCLIGMFLLHPTCAYKVANTHFTPSVLAAVCLAITLVAGRPFAQAVAFGCALATNQTFLILAPVVWGWWSRPTADSNRSEAGCLRATKWLAVSMGVFAAAVAPLLVWDARTFLAQAFFARNDPEIARLAGTFSFFPLVRPFGTHAGLVCTGLVGLAGLGLARVVHDAPSVVLLMSGVLCGALMFQPTSYLHYFLPAVALAAVSRGAGKTDGVISSKSPRHIVRASQTSTARSCT